MAELVNNTFIHHVSCTDGKISVRIKIGINFILWFHRRPIQIVVLVPLGLSSFLRPAEDVVRTTKGLQERTQLFEWDDGEN